MSKISTALRAAALGPAPSRRDAQIHGPVASWNLPADATYAVLRWRDSGERFGTMKEKEKRLLFLFVAEAEQ